jgi:hypothetical protein
MIQKYFYIISLFEMGRNSPFYIFYFVIPVILLITFLYLTFFSK